MKRIFLLFVVISLVSSNSFSQGQRHIDFLKKELKEYNGNSQGQLELLNKISEAYANVQYDSGIAFADKAMAMAERLNDREQFAAACNNMGYLFLRKSHFEKAREYFDRSLSIFISLNHKQGIASCYNHLAELDLWQGEKPEEMDSYIRKALSLYEQAKNINGIAQCSYLFARWNEFGDLDSNVVFRHIRKAVALFEQAGNNVGKAAADNFMGVVYEMRYSDYVNALQYYRSAIELNTSTGNLFGLCNDYINISGCYLSINDYTKAIESTLQGLRLGERMGDLDAQILMYGILGDTYRETSQNEKAVQALERGFKMAEETGSRKRIAQILTSLHNTYMDRKDYSKAFESLHKALEIDKEMNSDPDLADDYAKLANAFMTLSKYDSALVGYRHSFAVLKRIGENVTYANVLLSYARAVKKTPEIYLVKAGVDPALRYMIYKQNVSKALEVSRKIGVFSIQRDALLELSAICQNEGDLKNALDYFRQYVALKDTILNIENSKSVSNLQIKYETGKKEQQIALLNKDNVIKGKEIDKQKILRNGVFGGLVIVSGFLVLVFFQSNKIKKAKKRSDELLLNILPAEVAEELKSFGNSEARQFEEVTVLFTDFVNFTVAGEHMSPKELVSELHHCFKAFDEIIGKYNIEKIKTIGDAYLAVCGLPNADARHTEHIVNAALDIRRFTTLRRRELGDRTFNIRIGIHTGPVVAGIVGVKKFAYDIWGDTVNTAARLQEHSEAGRINISQTSYDMIKDVFKCTYRGEIASKNKAPMNMYFIEEENLS